jgi:hypothetical protein
MEAISVLGNWIANCSKTFASKPGSDETLKEVEGQKDPKVHSQNTVMDQETIKSFRK